MTGCCGVQGKEHVPLRLRPEATFLPALLDHFLELLPTVIKTAPVKTEAVETNGAATATPVDAAVNGEDDAMQEDSDDAKVAVATGAVDVEGAAEEAEPRRFFEDPNEPMRLEDLPAEPDEEQLLDAEEEDAAPGTPLAT